MYLDTSRFVNRRSRTFLLRCEHTEEFVHAALQAPEHRLLTGGLGARRVNVEVKSVHLGVHRSTGSVHTTCSAYTVQWRHK